MATQRSKTPRAAKPAVAKGAVGSARKKPAAKASPGNQGPDSAAACAQAVLQLLQDGGPSLGPTLNRAALEDLRGCKVEIGLHFSPETLLAILDPVANPDGLTVQQLSDRLARIQTDLLGVSVRACTYQNPDGSCAETLTPRKRAKTRK